MKNGSDSFICFERIEFNQVVAKCSTATQWVQISSKLVGLVALKLEIWNGDVSL